MLRRIGKLLWHTGTIKIFFAYVIVLCISGLILMFIEPQVNTFFDGVYFSFVASTTIGFGDIVPVTVLGRIITIITTLIGVLTVAMVPGVVVAYYTEYLKAKENETVSTFLEKLDHLPELSKEELEELSERVRQFKKRRQKIRDRFNKNE